MYCPACEIEFTGEHCLCGWPPEETPTAPIPRGYQHYTGEPYSAAHITKEEFGLALFDCIKLFAGRDQIRRYMATCSDSTRLARYRQREIALTLQIAERLEHLTPEDQRRLLTQYETKRAA